MGITLLAFGQLAEITGFTSVNENTYTTVGELKAHLALRYPSLQACNFAIAVNRKIAGPETAIPEGATVALLPPFSGG